MTDLSKILAQVDFFLWTRTPAFLDFNLLNLHMIQRKQTLFLLELIFLGIALLFVPSNVVVKPAESIQVYLLPGSGFESTAWHYLAISLNTVNLLLAFVAIFMFRKRNLQVKLSYVLLISWGLISLVSAFLPLAVTAGEATGVQNSYFGVIAGLFGMLAAYLAARFINKDIELLKSADRIR